MAETLDRADLKILRALQRDGRLSTVALAETVGLSPTATTERVKRLTRDGFIKGYHAVLDPALLDRALLVFVEVTLDKTTPDVFAKFAIAVRASAALYNTPDEVDQLLDAVAGVRGFFGAGA